MHETKGKERKKSQNKQVRENAVFSNLIGSERARKRESVQRWLLATTNREEKQINTIGMSCFSCLSKAISSIEAGLAQVLNFSTFAFEH